LTSCNDVDDDITCTFTDQVITCFTGCPIGTVG
jgi:hypothetical protein